MKCFGKTFVAVLVVLGSTIASEARAGFESIPTRNVFQLVTPVVKTNSEPERQYAKVSLLGITTIFGSKRAVLEVQPPAAGAAKAKPEFYDLREDQQGGDIEVVAIDEKTRVVRIKNAGTSQTLTFDPTAPSSRAAADVSRR